MPCTWSQRRACYQIKFCVTERHEEFFRRRLALSLLTIISGLSKPLGAIPRNFGSTIRSYSNLRRLKANPSLLPNVFPPNMEFLPSVLALSALFLIGLTAWKLVTNQRKFPNAPGIGYGSLPFFGIWKGVYTFMKDPVATVKEGCTKYKGGYFRVSTHAIEYTIVANKDRIAEYLAAPDEVLNFHDSVLDILQVEWTLGYGVAHRPYHIPLIRTKLTQSIAANIPSMFGEIKEGFNVFVGTPKGSDISARTNSSIDMVSQSGCPSLFTS